MTEMNDDNHGIPSVITVEDDEVDIDIKQFQSIPQPTYGSRNDNGIANLLNPSFDRRSRKDRKQQA